MLKCAEGTPMVGDCLPQSYHTVLVFFLTKVLQLECTMFAQQLYVSWSFSMVKFMARPRGSTFVLYCFVFYVRPLALKSDASAKWHKASHVSVRDTVSFFVSPPLLVWCPITTCTIPKMYSYQANHSWGLWHAETCRFTLHITRTCSRQQHMRLCLMFGCLRATVVRRP